MCGACIYWLQNGDAPRRDECRRYPPVREESDDLYGRRMRSVWPETSDNQGCGEFKIKARRGVRRQDKDG